ncbi:MAG: hypothetical protein K8R86_13155 [Bacteroidales bacterium]|nr:hypothetical protein [Bacteroidales bacterium]
MQAYRKDTKHWRKNYKWILWRCPSDHYSWFKYPIPLTPENITGKSKLTTMHGRFQGITPQVAIEIIKNNLSPEHKSFLWLTNGEFDEEIFSNLPSTKKSSGQKLRKKYNIKSGNAPTNDSFEYWVTGKRTVNPHHAILQAKFIQYLDKKKIMAVENQDYIDVQYTVDGNLHFTEIKPTETVESKYAIRAAIGQLMEYRYTSGQEALLEIVIGSKPKKQEVDFVKSIGIIITFYVKKTRSFVTIAP